jgi:hypothetical protein
MQETRLLGGLVTALGLGGYAVGVAVAYPGRALSVAAVMFGLALAAVGGGVGARGGEREGGSGGEAS